MDIMYSIIVATYNRLSELKELFDSIALLDFERTLFEVVISDDGSTDGTRQFVENEDHGFNILYLHQQNKGPGAARNLAMENANGEFFIFIDSDVLLPKNYLERIDSFLDNHEVDAFGGPDDSHPSFSDFLKAVNYAMTSFLGTGGTRGSTTSVTRFYPRSFNMGIHKEVYKKIGGMGGLRHGQDMDYSMRIYNEGFRVVLIPDAIVFHKRRTSLWRFFKQIFNWGVARINLGRKYREMLKMIHLLPAIVLALFLGLVLMSPFSAFASLGLKLSLYLAGVIASMAFLQSFLQYRSIKVSLLSIVTLFTQVLAYGLGIWSAVIQVILGRKTAKGISKNYYK
jgi:glycosyltransferase involved in cell wall biosynthesis